jgi:hypothetical protein
MAYPAYMRDKARELRIAKCLTIDEIAERLALPRTTIFYWVRDLPVPRSHFDPSRASDARRRAVESMRAKHRLLREEAYAEGLNTFGALNTEPTFRDFLCLYIAEGYKRNRNVVSLANSDPAVVKLADTWIRRFARNQIRYRVQFHVDQRLEELAAFWAAHLDIHPDQVKFQRKSNSNQLARRTWRCQYGVLTVEANDTLLRAKLGAWIDCLRAEWL